MKRIIKQINRKALVLSVLIAAVIFGFSAIKALSGGMGVSDSVLVKIAGSRSQGKRCPIEFSRVTRTGGIVEIPGFIENGSLQIFKTDDWASGFIGMVEFDDCEIESVFVSIGNDNWSFIGKEIATVESVDAFGNRRFVIDRKVLEHGGSKLGYFSGLINWPGDFIALVRILRIAVVKAAGLTLALLAIWLAAARLLFRLNFRQDQESTELERENARKFVVCILATVIAVLSLGLFFAGHGSAFEWPAMDMAPFWMRFFDPDFAVNSYFTDISMQPSPRWVFGYFVIVLSKAVGIGWYHIVFSLRVFFALCIPVVIFLSIYALLKRKIKDEGGLAVAVLITFVLVGFSLSRMVNSAYALALWSPLVLGVQPETLSLFCAFLAMWVFLGKVGKRYWITLAVALMFFATLLHPVRSLSVFAFFFLADHDLRLWLEYLVIFLGGIIAPAAVLLLSFPVNNPLSAEQFVYHYIKQNHDFHYLPSNFGAVNGIPWFVVFAFVTVPLVTVLLLGLFRKKFRLVWTSSLLLGAYCTSIVAEFFFVEVHPVKIFAIVTPVRFTSMGYWMVVVVLSWCVAEYYGQGTLISLPRFLLKRRVKICIGTALGLAALFFWASVFLVDDPWSRYRNDDVSWTEWVAIATEPGDVFASNILSVDNQLPIVHNRASFLGNGFAFREDDFEEYDARKDLLFGSYGSWEDLPKSDRPPYWSWSKDQYRNLSPDDFIAITRKHRIDYVIIEKGYDFAFVGVPIEYENDIFKVYSIDNFH